MRFWVREDGAGRIARLGSIASSVNDVHHEAKIEYQEGGPTYVRCSCAPEQPWRIPANWTPERVKAEVRETFNSHLSYFNRPKMVTL